MKKVASVLALGAFALMLSGCCGDTCCEPCPKPSCCDKPCPEQKPQCCPKPHIWDTTCCNPSHYELN